MDENAKARFKWKFYRLTVELNIIVLLVALCILVFFIIHSPYTIPVIVGMLALSLYLSWDFIRKYKETKAWLDDNAGKEKEHKQEKES
jgi:Ca2+/Na+ antiporter